MLLVQDNSTLHPFLRTLLTKTVNSFNNYPDFDRTIRKRNAINVCYQIDNSNYISHLINTL